MAAPSVTNTFTDATTIDAVAVMENFNDVINGVSDGVSDISVSVAAAAGYAAITGDVYSTALTDYSNIVTISGPESITTKYLYYKKIGNIVHMWFYILAESTAATDFYFDLPVTPNDCMLNMRIPILTGTTELNSCGVLEISAPSSAILWYAINSTAWPTGTECASGYFFYEVA